MLSREGKQTDRGAVGAEFIGYNRRRREALLLQEFPHQPNCRPSVPAGLNQEIQDFALTVHGTPEIELPPSNYDDHLVQVPAFGRSWPPTLNPPRIGPTEFQDPSSNCLIRDVETTLGKQVLNVPVAQRETAIEPDSMLDDDRWKAVTTVGYLAHPETLKHRPCRSHAANVTMPRAVHGLPDMEAPDPFLSVCPVRPEWTDPTGLTGYYDVLSNRYIVPPFLEAVMLATAHADSPVFVVLDEMNLARVEYYFSDVLSCIETGENLQLHSNSVPLEGSTGTSIPAELALPPNLYLTGTINIDETTSTVSDKVLDRAVVIDMSDVDIGSYLAALETDNPKLKDACAATGSRLVAVQQRMAQHGLGFGYRVAEEAVRYQAFVQDHVHAASTDATLDDLMVQKVLVKLRGAEKQRGLLTGLLEELEGLPLSTEFLNRLVHDLDEFGSFQPGR